MEDHVTSTVNDLLAFYKATKSNGPAQEDIDRNTELQKKIKQKSEFLDSLKRVVSGLNSFLLGVQSEQNAAVCVKGLLKESNASVMELVDKYKENFRMEMRNRTDQILYGPVEPRGNLLGDRQLERIREVVKEQERTIAALNSSPRMLQWERQKDEEDAIKQEIADIECETAKVRQIYAEEEGKICSILVKIGINIGEEMLRIHELSNSNVDAIQHHEEPPKGLEQIHIGVLEPAVVEASPSDDDQEQLSESEDGEDVSLAFLNDTSQFSFGFDFKISNTLPKLRQIMKPVCTYETMFNKHENSLLKGNKKEYKMDNGQKRIAQSDNGPPFKRVAQMVTNELQKNQLAPKPEPKVLTEIHDNINKPNTTHIKPVTVVKPKTTNEKKDPSEGKESSKKLEQQEAAAVAKTRPALKRKSPTTSPLLLNNTKPYHASFAALDTDSNIFLKPKSPTHQKKQQLQPQKVVKPLEQNKDHPKSKISKATSGCKARDAEEEVLPKKLCNPPESKENATKITDHIQASSPTSLGSPTSLECHAVDEAPGSGPESSSNGSLDILLQYSNGEFEVNLSDENLAPMSNDLDFLNDKFSRDEQNPPEGSGSGNRSTGGSFGFDFDEQLSMDQDQDFF